MFIRKLDLQATNYLKGIAILIIMLHNYFHILHNAPGENEFTFSLKTTSNLLHNLGTNPLDAVKQLFSYFGHYAVQVFIFLSGYGLAIKYKNKGPEKYGNFIFDRLKKLYPALFLAVIFLFCYKAAITLLFPEKQMDLWLYVQESFLKLTLVSNLVPGQGFTVSGPWWFFSLIFQLYLIAPFLLKLSKLSYLLLITAASILLQLWVLTAAPAYMEYVRLNLPGHLPEFCLGIYLARKQDFSINNKLLALVCILFIAGSFNALLWLLSSMFVPILFLAGYIYLNPTAHSGFTKVISFFGHNSLYFFVVHGLCRAPFVAIGNQSVAWSWVAGLGYILIVIALTILFKLLVQRVMAVVSPSG